MKLCVDASAVGARDGIGRYLAELLPRLRGTKDAERRPWRLYGRGIELQTLPFETGSTRSDHLPRNIGRVLSLATSQPLWLARDRPDLFWGPAHRLPLWLPQRTARVVTIHDLCWLKAPQTMRRSTHWLDATLMPRALKQADRIIAVSSATRDDLCAAFPDTRDRIRVVHEAAALMPAPLPAEALSGLGLRPGYVLFVGTLEPRKNLKRLLQAFARAAPQLPTSTTLAIAGPLGWGGEQVDTEAGRLGIADRVRILGRVDDVALSTLYRHAACLAMPSLYEGFGLPLLEAMAQGTPVLTSHTSSMPEVAGDAGLLVDPLSTESMADGLLQLLTDSAHREMLAGRAASQAARFSWDRAALETWTVFEEAVRVRQLRLQQGGD